MRLGKLPGALRLVENLAGHIERERFETLAISLDHAFRAGLLAGSHKDPFDLMLIAQAQAESLMLVSNETVFDAYGVGRIW